MLWFWIGGGLVAALLGTWGSWLRRRPAAPRWQVLLVLGPTLVWALSVAVAVWFAWRSWADLEFVSASEKQAALVQNITWAMDATLAGGGALVLSGLVMGILTLRAVRKRRPEVERSRDEGG